MRGIPNRIRPRLKSRFDGICLAAKGHYEQELLVEVLPLHQRAYDEPLTVGSKTLGVYSLHAAVLLLAKGLGIYD